ncbi:MAG: DNA polymerase III subunit delta [Candidatus Pacebacteria bacterium]|nr:DNA polymerase III subunit delta [Candidatus Paceibacterota bacterium]
MLYLFYGKDTFRLKRKLNEMIEDWKMKYGENGIVSLNANSIDPFDLRSEVFSVSMFSSKKFIIINSLSGNSKLKDYVVENGDLFANSENLILFIEEELKSGKSDAFSAFIKKKGHVEEFTFLEGKDLEQWIVVEAENCSVGIKNGVITELAKIFKKDLFGLENEIKKLSNYVLAEKRTEITLADVDKLVEKSEDGNIFAITDAVGARNKRLSFFLIDSYLKDNGVLLVLFATIATHVKNLMIVKESPNLSPGELGMNPYVRMKCLGQAKNFEFDELKELFDLLVELDRKMKVGQVGQEEAIELFVLSL